MTHDSAPGLPPEPTPELTPEFSVSIVSYNTRELLRACLRSLRAREAEGEGSLEITVADNGSRDGSVEMVRADFPGVRVLEMGGNVGFGRANNAALEGARGRFFCLINSDAEALPGSLARSRAFLEQHPDVGSVGGQLLWPDGRRQPSCGHDLSLAGVFGEQTFLGPLLARLLRRPLYAEERADGPTDVAQPTGAFMVIRRETFRAVGGFDPAYFMYTEDVDLNRRMRQAGWRLVFLPDVLIRHHRGASSGGDWRARADMVASNNRSRFYYFGKLQGPAAARRLRLICLLGTALRLAGWSLLAPVRPGARNKVKLFREVWRQTWGLGTNADRD